MSWESFCWSPERLLKNSEVLDGLLARHADAVVTDRERALVAIGVDPDREVALGAHETRLGDRGEAQTVVGVRCVRNQLPEEDLPVAVQGMDHQLQQLTDFGLKTAGFFCGRAHERAILGKRAKNSSRIEKKDAPGCSIKARNLSARPRKRRFPQRARSQAARRRRRPRRSQCWPNACRHASNRPGHPKEAT